MRLCAFRLFFELSECGIGQRLRVRGELFNRESYSRNGSPPRLPLVLLSFDESTASETSLIFVLGGEPSVGFGDSLLTRSTQRFDRLTAPESAVLRVANRRFGCRVLTFILEHLHPEWHPTRTMPTCSYDCRYVS